MSSYITKIAKEHGLTVKDATAPLALNVEPRHVRRGKVNEPGRCAFAECAKESLHADAAYFFRSIAYVQKGKKLTRYVLPMSMQKEVVAFDRGKAMEPGDYRLSPPEKSATLGAAMKRSKKRPGRHQPGNTTIKRKVVHRMTGIRKKTLKQMLAQP